VVVVSIVGLCFEAISYIIEQSILSSDRSSVAGVVSFMDPSSWDRNTPYRQVAECPDNGEVCICSEDYAKSADSFVMQQGAVACLTFRFQVGDTIFFFKPAASGMFSQAEMVAKYTGSPVVHAGIVSYVPPEQVDGVQNPDDIIVTEALKGEFKRVTQQSLRQVIQRWTFGGYSIRRVDTKYVHFQEHYQEMTTWLNTLHNQPFDSAMVNPTQRHTGTAGRYIKPDNGVSCQERARALAMYHAGGPGKWMCANRVLWTLAFPGGLNVDYDNPYDQCPGPGWPLTNMQEYPGTLMNEANIWNPRIQWHMPCNVVGCWIGAPTSARWQGGHPPTAGAASTPSAVQPPAAPAGGPTVTVPISVVMSGTPAPTTPVAAR
jgi:hypothetical protein